MPRIPLLSGSRLVIVSAPDDAVVLRPPPPGAGVADVGAAVRDALRFPLQGEPLEALVGRRARATILVEPPALPLPGAAQDPRQLAVVAVIEELERLGIDTGYQTILVSSGLARRPSQRDVEMLVTPETARRFHGRVVVHDVADPELVTIGEHDGRPLRVNAALVDTELVIVVTAAESVVGGARGGAVALGRAALRRARPAARRARDRRPSRDAVSPARAAEPAARLVHGTRTRVAALAGRVPGRGGRDGGATQPLHPPL